MKIQDTSIHLLKVKKKVVRTHGHTDKPKAICPTNFFQSWGHKHDTTCLILQKFQEALEPWHAARNKLISTQTIYMDN